MPTFFDQLVAYMDGLRDAAECEFWNCVEAPKDHHDCCLTGATPDEE
jgi:hypothetical protein